MQRRTTLSWYACLCVMSLSHVPGLSVIAHARPPEYHEVHQPTHAVTGGTIHFVFDRSSLDSLGWSATARDPAESDVTSYEFGFPLHASSTIQIGSVRSDTSKTVHREVLGGRLRGEGSLLFLSSALRLGVSNVTIGTDANRRWTVTSRAGHGSVEFTALGFSALMIEAPLTDSDPLRLVGEVSVSEALAIALEAPSASGVIIGSVIVEARIEPFEGEASGGGVPSSDRGGAIGPDVIVGDLHQMNSYGSVGGISGFAIGTISCNAGDSPLSWYANTNQHPVISQSMFRLKDGRFEQIGLSWVKHGFAALTGNVCDFGCTPPPGGTEQLGVGCSDPYSANLNGSQGNMGPRSDVNASTGYFIYPWSAPPASAVIGRRLQVRNSDLEPTLNEGAEYFIQSQYVTPDDAAAGNQANNASHRPITITSNGADYAASLSGFTQRERPAIAAWRDRDTAVHVGGATIPNDGTFWVYEKTSDLGDGFWRYEYAIQNVYSHRSARMFAVPIPNGVTVRGIDFHDVDYHSGEPYDLTDWQIDITTNEVRWSTETYGTNPNANALRWGTLYNFRLEADSPPESGPATIGLFRPGTPASTSVFTIVPGAPIAVCGDGFIAAGEECDPPDGIHCDEFCQWICGDGVIQGDEECDPPDGIDCDGTCRIIYICGDGAVDPGEECDPPNGVTCDASCLRIPTCGDGILDPGEECDPPNGVTCDAGCVAISNDDCVSAAGLCPGVYDSSTESMTNDGDVSCGVTGTSPDAWFAYTPLTDGTLSVDTCGSTLDTVLSIHSACSGGPGTELACNDDACGTQSMVSIAVTAGVEYLIRVAGWDGSAGPFRLTVSGPPCLTGPPDNDACVYTLSAQEGSTAFTTLQATMDGPDEPGACGAGAAQIDSDIWYCYVPSCTGTATISVCNSDFDSSVAVYAGCSCPEAASAIACDDDACAPQAEVTLAVTAGASYLIRVGGSAGATGTGTLDITCAGTGDALRGGLLWDKWWATNGSAEPAGTHPLYPVQGQQTGSTTFRCKECHGWDYQGVDGVYGSGSHFTGIPGVLGSTLTPTEMFDLVRGTSVANGHGFEEIGVSHQDIWDVVEFMQALVIDTDAYVDPAGLFLGDPVAGELDYTTGGMPPCIACHGADGTAIDFGTPMNPEWVGTIAIYNPWELLHKTRFGEPGAPMPSWLGDGGTDQGAADIGRYAQLNFPVDCTTVAHCDDALFCTGAEACVDGFCVEGSDPCPGGVCDEEIAQCLSGLCDTPTVVPEGSRYVAVTPAPGGVPVALRMTGDAGDPDTSCVLLYVQTDGYVGVDPVFQLPADWGTVHVTGEEVRPETTYRIRADCGVPGNADLSFAAAGTTWAYGDADENGAANFGDILLVVRGFQGNFDDAALEAMDLAPCVPDRSVEFEDVLAAVQAFQLAELGCTMPCE